MGVPNVCVNIVALEEGICVCPWTSCWKCFLGRSLVDMYAKCGNCWDVWSLFNKMPSQDGSFRTCEMWVLVEGNGIVSYYLFVNLELLRITFFKCHISSLRILSSNIYLVQGCFILILKLGHFAFMDVVVIPTRSSINYHIHALWTSVFQNIFVALESQYNLAQVYDYTPISCLLKLCYISFFLFILRCFLHDLGSLMKMLGFLLSNIELM